MNKKATSLKLNNIIKIGRKQIQITELHYNSGAQGEYVKIYGIDVARDYYIKPFVVGLNDKFEVAA
jgi:hypothetical protein